MTGHIEVASLNFIDVRSNTGPGINEAEFNAWLLRNIGNAHVYTPYDSDRLEKKASTQVSELGKHSLRNPFRTIFQQLSLAKVLANELAPDALLYYRHSRLAFAVALLQRKRPDVRIAVTRIHPSKSDNAIENGKWKKFIGHLISIVDDRLKVAICKRAQWVDCVTHRQATQLERETMRPVKVVMNGVNTNLFRPLSDQARITLRKKMDIPNGAMVVGYCGGFPGQRGAREISGMTSVSKELFGVVIGNISDEERAELGHDRIIFLGEMDYFSVPEVVGIFDIAVAFDIEERSSFVGNSNQKVRQALACGSWVLTQSSDLPLDENPYLGRNVTQRSPSALVEAVKSANMYIPFRTQRSFYAKRHLSADSIFQKRHEKIIHEVWFT